MRLFSRDVYYGRGRERKEAAGMISQIWSGEGMREKQKEKEPNAIVIANGRGVKVPGEGRKPLNLILIYVR
jgi:hypothetical protein